MNLFNIIRSLFGFKADVEESSPIDNLEQLEAQLGEKRAELTKAQQEFNELDGELSLKIQACDKLIEKGVKEGEFNKTVIQQRLDKLTDEFLTNIQSLSREVGELEQQKLQVEGDILAKAIDLTSRLTKAEQQEINDIIVTWKETGLIKGQEITSHTRAIVTALDEIVKGGEGSRGGKVIGHTKSGKPIYENKDHEHNHGLKKDHVVKRAGEKAKKIREVRGNLIHLEGEREPTHVDKLFREDGSKIIKSDLQKSHEPLAIELAGKGDVIYDSPVEGHYANAIVRKYVKDENGHSVCKYLFLKRASDKVVEPGKYCLPGGHIDEGETIEQAACRELYEEANLHCYSGYVVGKAKADDGKWCFYVECNSVDDISLALLDSESENAVWMSKDEWIEADLIFDLKDHLIAMESKTAKIKDIPDIMKGESDIEKGGFHPEKPNHKYVRREGSPGNYIYYYDSPDTKERDGKKYREGLYSSNVAPKEEKKKITDPSDYKLTKYLQDELDKLRPKGTKTYISTTKSDNMGYRTFIDVDAGSDRETEKKSYEIQDKLMELSIKLKKEHPELKTYVASTKSDNMGMRTFIDIDIEKSEGDNDLEKPIDIDNPFYYDSEDDLIKGKRAQEGEIRTWGGKKYRKQGGKWLPVGSGKKSSGDLGNKDIDSHVKNAIKAHFKGSKNHDIYEHDGKKYIVFNQSAKSRDDDVYHEKISHRESGLELHHQVSQDDDDDGSVSHTYEIRAGKKKSQPQLSTKQLKEHVENTSTDQLKKVAENRDHPHNDAAKRELERRGGDKKGEQVGMAQDEINAKRAVDKMTLDDMDYDLYEKVKKLFRHKSELSKFENDWKFAEADSDVDAIKVRVKNYLRTGSYDK